MKPDAIRAIDILQKLLDTIGPASLAYWTTPNVILTLAGTRGFCDAVLWDEQGTGLLEKWKVELVTHIKILKDVMAIVYSDVAINNSRGEKYTSFELVTKEGLSYALDKTELVLSIDVTLLHSKADIYDAVAAALKQNGRLGTLSDDDIYHISHGLALGYPDKAIMGMVDYFKSERTPFDETLLPADIRGADYYICPQPIYDYPRSLGTDKTIVAHEQLWSHILKSYYTSEFHQKLEADSTFLAKCREINTIKG